MNRADFVLAALAASGGSTHTPVQVQKLFFLLDKNIPDRVERQLFNFRPFDYGPFDPQVYREIELLATSGLAEINENGRWKNYRLTPQGQKAGEAVLATMSTDAGDYVKRLSQWVRGLSFADLVAAIYEEYPEMKVNSVFEH